MHTNFLLLYKLPAKKLAPLLPLALSTRGDPESRPTRVERTANI